MELTVKKWLKVYSGELDKYDIGIFLFAIQKTNFKRIDRRNIDIFIETAMDSRYR